MLPLIVFLGTIAGAWYLLIVRPQKDVQTQHGRLIERLQVGDHVLTVGGIYGRVVALEGSSVVLELAPGLTSRITTDGLARIVQGGEATLPTTNHAPLGVAVDAAPTPRQALEDSMHHQHDPQQQPQHPAYATHQAPAAAPAPTAQPLLPPQPFATPAPTHVAHTQPMQQVQHGSAAPAPATTTFRAQVLPAIPTFEPRPWPGASPTQHAAPPQHAAPQYAAGPPQQPQPHAAPQPYGGIPSPPAPVFAVQPPPPVPSIGAPSPQHYAPAAHPVAAPAQHVQYAQAPAQGHGVEYAAHAQAEPQVSASGRTASRAPAGMGSSLRLDDPSIRDIMVRARSEREGLAAEYRKLTAPLVDVTPHPAHAAPHVVQAGQPQLVGHDAHGTPLFVSQQHGGHAASQYPAPARVPVAPPVQTGVPRPHFSAGPDAIDDAFSSPAFQRRTPYSPDQRADAEYVSA